MESWRFPIRVPRPLGSISNAIVLVFLAGAVLNLYLAPGQKFVPDDAEVVTFVAQVFLFLLALPALWRARGHRASSGPLPGPRPVPHRLFLASGLFLVTYGLASALWSPEPALSFERGVYMFLPLAMLGWLVMADPRPLGTARRLAVVLVGLGSGLSATGFLLYAVGEGHTTVAIGSLEIIQVGSHSGGMFRIASLTGNPNLLATWLLSSLLATLYLAAVRALGRGPALALGAVQLSALLMTGSRTGIVATLAGCALFAALMATRRAKASRPWWLTGVSIGALSLVVLLYVGPWDGLPRLSLDMPLRPVAWTTAWEAFTSSWLLGVGFGTSYEYIFQPRGLPFIHAHNVFLSFLSELGILGLGALLLLGATALGAALRLRGSADPSERCYGAFVAALLVALGIHEMFETVVFVSSHQSVAFTMLVGFFAMAGLRMASPAAAEPDVSHRAPSPSRAASEAGGPAVPGRAAGGEAARHTAGACPSPLRAVSPDGAMRVCFVSHTAEKGGAERTLLELVSELRDHGIEPYVLLPREGPLAGDLAALGIPYEIIHYGPWVTSGKRTLRKTFRCLARSVRDGRRIKERVKAWRCDIVYTNTSTVCAGAVAAWLAGVPHVWHIHELIEQHHGSRFRLPGSLPFRMMSRLSAVCVVNSRAVMRHYAARIPREKLRVVYSMPHLAPLPDRMAPARGEDRAFRCAMVGSLQPGKGQHEGIWAVSQLVRDGLDVRLTLAGDVGKRAYARWLKRLVAREAIESHVVFAGHVEDPLALLCEVDAVLVCSRHEGFGRGTIEAMHAARPVIAAACGATVEIVREGFNGLLYTPGSHEALAEKIVFLYEHPQAARELGENGRRWVRGRAAAWRPAEAVAGILHQVGGGGTPRAGSAAELGRGAHEKDGAPGHLRERPPG